MIIRLISENDLGERFENPNVVERYISIVF